MRPRLTTVLATLVLLGLAAGSADARPSVIGGQYRYWAFNNHNDLRDVLAYWVPGPFHVQLEYWDRMKGKDSFRPEVGIHLRDRHRSVYTVQWRHELDQERFWFMTDQVVSDHLVGRLEVDPIVTSDSTTWVFGGGGDYYWGSYNFLSATLYHDPRGDNLWVVPVRLRLANESNDWVQMTLAPASRRTLGWAFDFKYRWVRAGVERNSRFDFTNLDNVVFTAGFEVPFPRPRE
jgi:hypothetical protein